MDFLAAYSAVNQGHNHPRIAEAMIAQIRKLALTSRAFRNDQFPPLLEKLCRLTGFDKALLMNSGAEAVETAIKAMRKWAYDVKGVPYPKAEIIVAEGNFHGRTTTIVGFSTDPDSTSRFGPFTPGFRIVAVRRSVAAVEAAITPEHRRHLRRADPGRGGRRHPAGRLPQGPARAGRPAQAASSSSTRSSRASAAPGSSSPSSTRGSAPTASRSARPSPAASTPSAPSSPRTR